MIEEEIIKRFEAEGYDKVWIYDAKPEEVDEEHDHNFDTKLHILSGKIKLKKSSGKVTTDFFLTEGDEIEVPRHHIHSAKVGMEGCRYVVAERY